MEFEVQPDKTFVYPEDAPDDTQHSAEDDEADAIRDIMREEAERAVGLPMGNGYADPARDEREFDDTDLLPAFYPKKDPHGPTIVDCDHPLFLPANLQLGLQGDEYLEG